MASDLVVLSLQAIIQTGRSKVTMYTSREVSGMEMWILNEKVSSKLRKKTHVQLRALHLESFCTAFLYAQNIFVTRNDTFSLDSPYLNSNMLVVCSKCSSSRGVLMFP